jgi:hypothetical protein
MVILSFGLIASAALGAHPVDARKHGRHKHKKKSVITRTFTEDDGIVMANPDAHIGFPFPSSIQVRGFKKGKIVDVDLVLRGLIAQHPDDMDVVLVGPGDRFAFVMSDAGGATEVDDAITLRLDDQASEFLPDSGSLASGRFKPSNYEIPDPGWENILGVNEGPRQLSTFNGINPNGEWGLFTHSDADPGTIFVIADGWQLIIKAEVKAKHKKR